MILTWVFTVAFADSKIRAIPMKLCSTAICRGVLYSRERTPTHALFCMQGWAETLIFRKFLYLQQQFNHAAFILLHCNNQRGVPQLVNGLNVHALSGEKLEFRISLEHVERPIREALILFPPCQALLPQRICASRPWVRRLFLNTIILILILWNFFRMRTVPWSYNSGCFSRKSLIICLTQWTAISCLLSSLRFVFGEVDFSASQSWIASLS